MATSQWNPDRRAVPWDELRRGFMNPPAEARPFVRWWWNNNQVEKQELVRELDLLHEAGVGGVEINPILESYLSWEGVKLSQAKVLEWRSPEWDEIVRFTAEEAEKRGIIVDLIGGSSWPFGGEFLEPKQQVQRLSIFREAIEGPAEIELDTHEILTRVRDYGYQPMRKAPINGSLHRVWLHPASPDSIEDVLDISAKVDDAGMLRYSIPQGQHIIAFGVHEWGFRRLGNGVPGARGPALDHFQTDAVHAFLDRVLAMGDCWDRPMNELLRAIFCDSIEIGEANWTHDMAEAFASRMGYDIEPYLPIILRPDGDDVTPSDDMQNTLERARYDWTRHLVETFHERFTRVLVERCHEHGLLCRYQAQGNPLLLGLAEGNMIPDITEGERWLHPDEQQEENERFTYSLERGDMVWLKYASAGSRLRNKRITSHESMTNVLKLMQATPGMVKQSSDMAFIAGVTHGVLHGFNYSPPDVPFPGLIRFGTYFSEHNPWWPEFRLWANYFARLAWVFQSASPVADVAILAPTADVWGKHSLNKEQFHINPNYVHRLWESIAQIGETCDYLHEPIIQGADVKNGRLTYGPMAYRLLMVVDAESLQPETAEAINRLAENGVQVVYVDQVPHRAPGLMDREQADARVTAAVQQSLANGSIQIDPPKQEDDRSRRSWLIEALDKCHYPRQLAIESPDDGLYTTRYRSEDGRDIVFLVNTRPVGTVSTAMSMTSAPTGWQRWDPLTGEGKAMTSPDDNGRVHIKLGPLESLLLVANLNDEPSAPTRQTDQDELAVQITGPWQVEFAPPPGHDTFWLEFPELAAFELHTDPRVNNFAGTATYLTDFDLESTEFSSLNLGDDRQMVTRVRVNGQDLGANWFGSPDFEVTSVLQIGRNTIEIEYATPLYNALHDTPFMTRWWKKFNRTAPPLQKLGLLGPITLSSRPLP